MNFSAQQSPVYFIGWDVGGWNCDKNSKSRDAIVILDGSLRLVGNPWRGNLRESINEAESASEWGERLFGLCDGGIFEKDAEVILAIDTPLGFPQEFLSLANGLKGVSVVNDSATNRYLYRRTERYLFELGLKPLSPIKDMIGSHATKGMHVLGKFAPKLASCGVWNNQKGFVAIESYPTACRNAPLVRKLREGFGPTNHSDAEDALVCALMAYLFATNPDTLEQPDGDVPQEEGWIWIPKDR